MNNSAAEVRNCISHFSLSASVEIVASREEFSVGRAVPGELKTAVQRSDLRAVGEHFVVPLRRLARDGSPYLWLRRRRPTFGWFLILVAAICCLESRATDLNDAAQPARKATVRIAASQPKSRLIDYHLKSPAEVLRRVDQSLGELESIVHKAGEKRCDVVVLPEDTLGLGHWEAGNPNELKHVLPEAVDRMLNRLGRAAASHRMYLICCNDTIDSDGAEHNTAFFLGRDGKEIGRYQKVNMPIHELNKKRGDSFPIFPTPDLGGVGMLICYDMVFPEAPRCLALGGADIIFHPTLGGAAIGDGDISQAAFRTRAVDNFVYLVVSQRGNGSMIISPRGDVLAQAKGVDSFALADIDPFSGREGGDAMNYQEDMRSRLFRERSPAAFKILTDPNPPALKKIRERTTIEEAVRISQGVLTEGEEKFKAAAALERAGKRDDAIRAFEALIADYPRSWIDRVSRERLAKLRKE